MIQTGIETGVKTYLIMSPLIYGLGSGHFNRLSIQVPSMIRTALKTKQAEVIGDGMGEWDHVHIDDLVSLYELIVAKIVAGEEIPSGEQGFYFSENGRHCWRDLAQGVGDALLATGRIGKAEVQSINLEEGAERWTGGDGLFAELAYASKYVNLFMLASSRLNLKALLTDVCGVAQGRSRSAVVVWDGIRREARGSLGIISGLRWTLFVRSRDRRGLSYQL